MARKQLQNLTESMFYVLLCFRKPLHGYGVMKRINQMTNGRVKVGPGTLYNLIARFEKENIVLNIESTDNKKTYVLTEKGYELLEEEWKRLKQLVGDYEDDGGIN